MSDQITALREKVFQAAMAHCRAKAKVAKANTNWPAAHEAMKEWEHTSGELDESVRAYEFELEREQEKQSAQVIRKAIVSLLSRFPKCDHIQCSEPATRVAFGSLARWCDYHAMEGCLECPESESLRDAKKALSVLDGD